jgi:dipeptidyl aminopeptidase/acylaminoacyl peptidase
MLAGLLTTPEKFPLTIESIMRGYALVGHAPRALMWSADGSKLGFEWTPADGTQNPSAKSYVVNRDGTGLKEGGVEGPKFELWDRGSKAGYRIVYLNAGDVWLRDTFSSTSENLTKSTEREYLPVIAQDGESVVFQKSNELFRMNLADRKISQVTQAEDVKKPEIPVTIVTPKDHVRSLMVTSPSGKHMAMNFGSSPSKRNPQSQVPNYMANGGVVQLQGTYEKPGGQQPRSFTRIYNLKTGASFEFTMPRPGITRQAQWSPDGRFAVTWGFSEDHKDGWLFCFDSETEKVSTLWTEHDDAWLGGPLNGLLGWLPDSSRLYFQSEKTGYANLMTLDPRTGATTNLTDGPFEVSDVRLDTDNNRFIIVSSEGSPFERHIDAVSFDGGPRTKLADYSAGDDASFAISPTGQVAVVRSFSNRPPELFVKGVQVTVTPTKEWLTGPWIVPPIVSIPARDGVKVPAKLFKPKNWRRGGPAVVFVHGAGYLQNVFNGWSYYSREYMFHHVLMEKGYAVLDIDYRASAGYGKAWRTAIYRHMGGKDLDDVIDGAKWMVKELGAAPDRLGVYGGSYGGFITFMAMFTAPDVFKSGAALRPVGDWANYHHGYVTPILNNPQDDPEAYKVSSPINFVEGLKGNLLICHGMVDMNVQFQDSVRVVQRLIDLGKKNWEVAPYPLEDHSFTRPSSWTDEYNRIFNLFERTIGTKRR